MQIVILKKSISQQFLLTTVVFFLLLILLKQQHWVYTGRLQLSALVCCSDENCAFEDVLFHVLSVYIQLDFYFSKDNELLPCLPIFFLLNRI